VEVVILHIHKYEKKRTTNIIKKKATRKFTALISFNHKTLSVVSRIVAVYVLTYLLHGAESFLRS